MNNIHRETIAIPLEQEAHDRAIAFATQQSTPQKSRCVYLNTLAVYAVHTYLKWLEIDTALDEGDSWHPGLLPLFDVADCVVSRVGRLECRPVLPGETSFTLPQDRLEDRIGYVAVQFQESLYEVNLLGFVPAFDSAHLPKRVNLNQLLPIEDLPEHVGSLEAGIEFLQGNEPIAVAVRELLDQQSLTDMVTHLERIYRDVAKDQQMSAVRELLEMSTLAEGLYVSQEQDVYSPKITVQQVTQQLAEDLFNKLVQIWGKSEIQVSVDSKALAKATEASTSADVSLGKMLENLRQRFENLFEGDWLEPSMVFVPAYWGDRTRSSEPKSEASIRRAKIIDFGLPTGATQALALVIELTPESNQEVRVSVEVYPDSARHLPLGLQVIALDESGATIIDEQAESGADSIELEFGIEPLERFSVKLSLGNVSVTESI